MEQFDNEKIRLYDVNDLSKIQGVESWKSSLRNSRWHGPFKWTGKSVVLIFHSVTHDGIFDGLALGIELGSQRIYLMGFINNGLKVIGEKRFSETG